MALPARLWKTGHAETRPKISSKSGLQFAKYLKEAASICVLP